METGEKLKLKNQEVEAVKCEKCESMMANIDADQLAEGDLVLMRKVGLLVSNPETKENICVNCEYQTVGHRLREFFRTEPRDDDNDSSFFGGSSGGFFGGSSGGGFGGFGGGSFGGAGATRGF